MKSVTWLLILFIMTSCSSPKKYPITNYSVHPDSKSACQIGYFEPTSMYSESPMITKIRTQRHLLELAEASVKITSSQTGETCDTGINSPTLAKVWPLVPGDYFFIPTARENGVLKIVDANTCKTIWEKPSKYWAIKGDAFLVQPQGNVESESWALDAACKPYPLEKKAKKAT